MKYGKLFTKYIHTFGDKPSKNRCSYLSHNELRAMAKNLYHNNGNAKMFLTKYQNMTTAELCGSVYNALTTL